MGMKAVSGCRVMCWALFRQLPPPLVLVRPGQIYRGAGTDALPFKYSKSNWILWRRPASSPLPVSFLLCLQVTWPRYICILQSRNFSCLFFSFPIFSVSWTFGDIYIDGKVPRRQNMDQLLLLHKRYFDLLFRISSTLFCFSWKTLMPLLVHKIRF